MATARQILLPFSSAHLTEALPTWGKRREDFVVTVFSLSRGWQMRSPLKVRRDELRAALAGNVPVAREVFTLEPDVLFADRTVIPSATDDLPVPWQEVHRRLTAVSALYASMVDDERIDASAGRAAAQQWADGHHALAVEMRNRRTPPEHARLNTTARLMGDIKSELALSA